MATLAQSFVKEVPTNKAVKEILRCRTVKDPKKNSREEVRASVAELRQALSLLDTDDDGRLAEEDVDVMLELALGVDARTCQGTWRAVKGSCMYKEGDIDLSFLLKLLGTETFSRAIEQMKLLPPEPRLYPFNSVLEYVQVFREFDKDKNGLVCAKDLQKVIFDGVVCVPREHCKEIIRRVDPENTSAVVNLLQFGKLITLLTSSDLCSAEVKHTL